MLTMLATLFSARNEFLIHVKQYLGYVKQPVYQKPVNDVNLLKQRLIEV